MMCNKKIQVLTYSGKEVKYQESKIIQNSLHDIQSLDEFDINVLDLSAAQLWVNNGLNKDKINDTNDFISISEMIRNHKTSKVIILLPQNSVYKYSFSYDRYHSTEELKDMLVELSTKILYKLYQPLANIGLSYENTKTVIGKETLSAAFYFKDIDSNVKCYSVSNKPTCVEWNEVIITTLCVTSTEVLWTLLNHIGLLEEKQAIPDWFTKVKMFDDDVQHAKIHKSIELIAQQQKNIEVAQDIIDYNNRLKSVIYTTGDELVKVIFEIFEEILNCDLSGFIDVKKEDLLIELDEAIFIGEIKGVNPNVKSTNISQVDTHYHDYLESHPETDESKLKALLIINHQKSKAIEEREPVMEQQINLAKRNKSLIIETYTLLRVLELYRIDKVTRDKFINVLQNKEGLLEITDFD